MVHECAEMQMRIYVDSFRDNAMEDMKKDMELALRLMEYRDFTEAPLFKDLRIRTIYEGLRGHGNRQNALEEFFL